MDPAKMKVVDLRTELGALGLDTKGNKPALVERLRKALEDKTGNAVADSTILDTSTEEVEEPPTPRRSAASRSTRRSSSSLVPSTPAKQPRLEETIEEAVPEESDIVKPKSPEKAPEAVQPPQPVAAPEPEPSPEPDVPSCSLSLVEKPHQDDIYCLEDSQSPGIAKDDQAQENDKMEVDQQAPKGSDENKIQAEADSTAEDNEMDHGGEKEQKPARELTEEEEWQLLNERLKIKEQQRIEREKKQAEDDAKKFEELSNDPVKLNRLKRKHEKKQRWSNFYRAVEVTNEVLTPPTEEEVFGGKGKQKKNQAQEFVHIEPELDDSKVTLSWYDSDLNQYMELPELNSVVPLSDNAFAHAWAGARASHGVRGGRVCYEVRVGAIVATNESSEKNDVTGLRIGWSTKDQSLHLGEGETSWAFESSGRAVHKSEFKEYAKKLEERDVVGVYLDLESSPCTISYTINGEEQGVAYEFEKESLGDRAVFPHILTKNICYKVNLGNDRYTMMTRTKIVRNRVEIPIEQVLEEKKRREEELKTMKEEAEKREQEKKEKDKLERENRLKKTREEKQKAEREKKEKERQERIERGEPEPEERAQDGEAEKPQENGDEAQEPAQTDADVKPQEPAQTDADVKPQTDTVGATADDKQAEAKSGKEKADATVKEEPTPEGEPQEVTEEQALTAGHVLDKRIKFVTRYTVEEELAGEEAKLLDGYVLMARANLVDGPRRPATLAECEVILMVGMPGAGKTHWAHQHCAANPEKRYNIISTGALFEQMKVDCKPLRPSYEGRWDTMVSKCAKCILKLLEVARARRRNYILDQTNVYPSAQRRKLREFEGYRRVAVVVVPSEENYNERRAKTDASDGKQVPDTAVVDMKANFTLPEKGVFLDDVIYAELDKEEAEKVVEAFHKEAKSAGVVKENERKDRSASRDVGHSGRKRERESNDRRREDWRGSGSRDGHDREERWGGSVSSGGGGGGRWGPAARGGGGGGGRWGGGGGRDRGPPPGGRYGNDRWGFGGRDGGGGGRRDNGRDGFRGGRGGQGVHGPPSGPRPNQGPPARFDRDRNSGGGGGGGTWHRGGQQPQRGGNNRMPPGGNRPVVANKDNQNQQNQQGWNQWAGGWGGWGGWNQNQGWGNWGNNWGNWNQQQHQFNQGHNANSNTPNAVGAAGNNKNAAATASAGQANQNQWGNYTAQQWYQWHQWQQQQQGWPGYQQQQQQGNQQQQSANPQADAEAWAQYYQNYGNAAAANTAIAQKADKK